MDALVYVVDDDQGMLESLAWLLESVDVECRCFADGQTFLDELALDRPACLVLDVRMPNLGGFDVFQAVLDRRAPLPVIFVTANGDVPMAVRAMHKGAFDFIEKPYNPQEMLDLIFRALRAAQSGFEERSGRVAFMNKLAQLSTREREILREVVRGKHSKVIAHELGISCKTVDVHRTSIRDKFQNNSVAGLVKEVLTYLPDWNT